MGECKTAVSPLLTHWRYCSLALNHWSVQTGENGFASPSASSIYWSYSEIKITSFWRNFSSLAALEIVILAISSAASNENFIKMKTFHFRVGPLRWRHNDHAGVSNHQPHACLLNRLFRRSSKKTSKLRVTGLCAGNSPGPVNSPHKGPVTRKMFSFDDVILSHAGAIYWYRPQPYEYLNIGHYLIRWCIEKL